MSTTMMAAVKTIPDDNDAVGAADGVRFVLYFLVFLFLIISSFFLPIAWKTRRVEQQQNIEMKEKSNVHKYTCCVGVTGKKKKKNALKIVFRRK